MGCDRESPVSIITNTMHYSSLCMITVLLVGGYWKLTSAAILGGGGEGERSIFVDPLNEPAKSCVL